MKMLYDVSVIIAQYKPDFNSLVKTIRSVIGQKKVSVQIIIADDGSEQDYFDKTEEYLKAHNFNDYKFSKCETNCGTCINFKNAVAIAEGEYIKPISPGDYLYDENTLYNWITFCKNNNVLISYGIPVYYKYIDNELIAFEKKLTQPALNYLYKINNENFSGRVLDNIVLCDCILGASYLCENRIFKKYITEISGTIRFCEDFSYRLMLLDGESIIWYDKAVIYYRYGEGISNKKDIGGNPLLRQDEIAFDKLLAEREMKTDIGDNIQKYMRKKSNNRIKNRLMSFVLFPKALIYRVIRFYFKCTGQSKSYCVLNRKFVDYIERVGI